MNGPLVSTFFQKFIVPGMYNFAQTMQIIRFSFIKRAHLGAPQDFIRRTLVQAPIKEMHS